MPCALQREKANVRAVPALVALVLLGGCAGYASDYWKPKDKLIGPQLARYRMSSDQSQCVERRLTQTLSVWQLRQLGDLAGRLAPGGDNPRALGPSDLVYVAGLAKDPKVGIGARHALDACGITAVTAASPMSAAPPRAAPQPASAGLVPGASAPAMAAALARPALWVNLGTAATGQAISVDASSLADGPSWRQAWFRLTNPGQAGAGDIAYLLRVDCAAKSITALGGRKYRPAGAMLEQKDYPAPEGPLAVESGTVMELAFRGVCS
jgi:hypothetical protein